MPSVVVIDLLDLLPGLIETVEARRSYVLHAESPEKIAENRNRDVMGRPVVRHLPHLVREALSPVVVAGKDASHEGYAVERHRRNARQRMAKHVSAVAVADKTEAGARIPSQ